MACTDATIFALDGSSPADFSSVSTEKKTNKNITYLKSYHFLWCSYQEMEPSTPSERLIFDFHVPKRNFTFVLSPSKNLTSVSSCLLFKWYILQQNKNRTLNTLFIAHFDGTELKAKL